jgi:7-carboxy-7-deazaguanine synthase
MRTYMVKDVFRTIQGEGFHAGMPAVFVRLAGCNMWSGREADRGRDAARNSAACPRWCDTDFVGGAKMTLADLEAAVSSQAAPLVVVTGGEPMLQVDVAFLIAVSGLGVRRVAIETNGTVRPTWWPATRHMRMASDTHGIATPRPWITLSPKVAREHTLLTWADEIKIVMPAYSPDEWSSFDAVHRFVSPQGPPTGRRDVDAERDVAVWVASQSAWRLSLQAHKIVGMP